MPTEDYPIEIKVNEATANIILRKADRLNIRPDILVDLCGQMHLSEFEARDLPNGTRKGAVSIGNAGGSSFKRLPISKQLAKSLQPYITALEVRLTNVMQDAIVAMKPNIQRMLPINARSMSSIHKQLYHYEQQGQSVRHQ